MYERVFCCGCVCRVCDVCARSQSDLNASTPWKRLTTDWTGVTAAGSDVFTESTCNARMLCWRKRAEADPFGIIQKENGRNFPVGPIRKWGILKKAKEGH